MLRQVARTSAGLVNKEHRLCSRGADGAGTSMEVDGGELAAKEAEEDAELAEDVLCVTVDGKGANTSRFITLHMIYEATETEVRPVLPFPTFQLLYALQSASWRHLCSP